MPKFIFRFKGKPRKHKDILPPGQHVKLYNEHDCYSLDRDFGEEGKIQETENAHIIVIFTCVVQRSISPKIWLVPN
jgi:hypothetical protein